MIALESPRLVIHHTNRLRYRLEQMLEKLNKQSRRYGELLIYKHCLACGYLNSDGIKHVDIMVTLMEGEIK